MKLRSSALFLPVLVLIPLGALANPGYQGNLSFPFTVIVPPNPASPIAVLAIQPTQLNTSPTEGASLARFAKNQYLRAKKWKKIVIVVCNDRAALRQFGDSQARRRGQALGRADYKNLMSVWRKTICYYEYQDQGRKEQIYFPSKNPAGWWKKWK